MELSEDTDRLLSRLKTSISSVEESLEPLIAGALSDKAKALSPVERAKLYSHVVYAIESVLFSYLRLNGVKATEHPVFRELKRVQQYFEKIKAVEAGPEQRKLQLDKPAAARIIKHGLAGDASPGQPEQKESKPADGVKRKASSGSAGGQSKGGRKSKHKSKRT